MIEKNRHVTDLQSQMIKKNRHVTDLQSQMIKKNPFVIKDQFHVDFFYHL
jgi:hypothetical protein